jgi:hypothetical protein
VLPGRACKKALIATIAKLRAWFPANRDRGMTDFHRLCRRWLHEQILIFRVVSSFRDRHFESCHASYDTARMDRFQYSPISEHAETRRSRGLSVPRHRSKETHRGWLFSFFHPLVWCANESEVVFSVLRVPTEILCLTTCSAVRMPSTPSISTGVPMSQNLPSNRRETVYLWSWRLIS